MHLATKYGIMERKTRMEFNGAKRRFLDHLQSKNQPPFWIQSDSVKFEKFMEVKRMMKEARKRRYSKRQEEDDPNLTGPEDLEVEDEEEPEEPLNRQPSFFRRIKQEVHEEIEPGHTEIPEDIEPGNQVIHIDQNIEQEGQNHNVTTVAKPVGKRRRGRPKGSIGTKYTKKRRASAPAKLTKPRGWRRSARLQQGETMAAPATVDRRRSSPTVDHRRSSPMLTGSSTVSTVSARTTPQIEEYDQEMSIDLEHHVDQVIRRVDDIPKRKAVKRPAVDSLEAAEERYKKMKNEYKLRIKELEEELKSKDAENACAWRMVFEHRQKLDNLGKTLRRRDMAKVEEQFPEMFRI